MKSLRFSLDELFIWFVDDYDFPKAIIAAVLVNMGSLKTRQFLPGFLLPLTAINTTRDSYQ